MPCHTAAITDFLKVKADDSIESVLARLEKDKYGLAVVLSDHGNLEGYLTYQAILKNLLPVEISMGEGIDLGLTVKVAPGVAKRFTAIQALPVRDFMQRKAVALSPDTPSWEAVHLIAIHGEPVFLIEPKTQKLIGVLSGKSVVNDLKTMKNGD